VAVERARGRVCDRVLWRRAAARAEARSSAEGASPNMKNLVKTNRMRARVSWPMRNPEAKDPEEGGGY
jgi:hypothetical protein